MAPFCLAAALGSAAAYRNTESVIKSAIAPFLPSGATLSGEAAAEIEAELAGETAEDDEGGLVGVWEAGKVQV